MRIVATGNLLSGCVWDKERKGLEESMQEHAIFIDQTCRRTKTCLSTLEAFMMFVSDERLSC